MDENEPIQDNGPHNMWWVAEHSRKVTDKPLARWILEMPVVFYRLSDGTLAALHDRCPHR
ncbi:MAG: Rieske 2Fe-2S domain-containing protein [Sedimentitalea sp.]|uniref:Rieske 2Fe-2S domain-containing protein n=1 Tax=Sedimentitalea sp. TaxID=2048915 RepID=UPI003267883E